ncbi:FliM/FliN family flagellar motor switch protein [Amnibacterium sp. CER49]|uniref:FliM/FliN family flagellar motor switch protein n=1 Tax=Amnibacterium sp. CER49 TaxID=3039161 RepID=UPI002447BC0C|nr:FliM/FliN family flagellar motor switch protein [Amnibacterium sp. CER49]MDH2443867.1 FliM/FliN family flagellar motor switch protein [Amnibacterium sp. CER49]
MTFQTALPDARTTGTDGTAEAAIADALVAALPGAPLLAQRHVGAPLPGAALEAGVSASYVGAASADLGLILLDRGELLAAGGADPTTVRIVDVLRPALEHATAVIGGGMLGEAVDGVPAALLDAPDTVVFDLIGETGIAGWFAVQLREQAAPAAPRRDVTSRLGRISGVEMSLTVEIGRARVSVADLLDAQPGTVIELDRAVGADADVLLNGRLIATGEIVVVDRRFAVRITRVLDTVDEG